MDAEMVPIVDRLKDSAPISRNRLKIGGNDLGGGINVFVNAPPKGLVKEYRELFTNDAVEFMADLVLRFEAEIEELYNRRLRRKWELRVSSKVPKFSKSTRADNWKVAPVGERLQNRHLDLGDVSPSDISHFAAALRSRVQGVQVDFDDGHCPTWRNQILGLTNVCRAVRGHLPGVPEISRAPVLMLRPRAWNMIEKNVTINGRRIPGPVFDFSLLMFHCGAIQLAKLGTSGTFYLSKVEGATEAKLWNAIFAWSERRLGFPRGSIKACVLIENILSAFEMDDILWELRERSLGLNCGIWDYAASIIAKFGVDNDDYMLPDRGKYVNVGKKFLRSYVRLVVETCRKRAAHATGGMAANLLPLADEKSPDYRETLRLVCEAKLGEIMMGLDGFMVYDLGLVEPMNRLWREHGGNSKSGVRVSAGDSKFREHLLAGNSNCAVTESDLLSLPRGGVTIAGLEHNIGVGVLFVFHWLTGRGHFPFRGFVEDSATAEISRSQVWQWIRFGARLEDDGARVTRALVTRRAARVVTELQSDYGATEGNRRKLLAAFDIFLELVMRRDFPEFITTYLNEEQIFRKTQSNL